MNGKGIEFNEKELPDYELIVEVGSVESEHGMTRMILDGSGQLVAEHEAKSEKTETPEKQSTFQESMDAVQIRDLMRLSSQFDWSRKFPSRPGIPDEAVVSWSFRRKHGEQVTLKAWLRETEQDKVMGPVLKSFREHLDRMSKGQLYL